MSVAKLYYTPTSCGAASFIAATKAGLIGSGKLETEEVSIRTHKTASGADFYAINPKGNVPALVLADGTLLNEGAASLQWIADQAPSSGLAPAYGTSERYVLFAKLNYCSSEVHASYGPLFNPALAPEARTAQLGVVGNKLTYLSTHELANGGYLTGSAEPTVADIYLYIILSWSGYVGVKLEDFSVIKAYYDKIAALPMVVEAQAAMAAAQHA